MSLFNVILVGAGEINFGSVEGAWNHVSMRYDFFSEILDSFLLSPNDSNGTSLAQISYDPCVLSSFVTVNSMHAYGS